MYYISNSLTHLLQQTSCSYNKKYRGASMSGTVSITSGSESDLMNAVTNVGPASTAVDASSNGFRVNMTVCYCIITIISPFTVLLQWSVRLFEVF